MDLSILQNSGAPAVKQTKYVPLGTKRFFTGKFTSRNPLQEPGTRAESRFYGGRPDAMWDGLNIEVSADNTPIRRPGFSTYATLPSPGLDYYCFRAPLQPIKLISDTATNVYLSTPTTNTSIMTKSPGAGQTHFQGVGTQLFMANGIDCKKWNGTTLSKWGIAPPLNAPTLSFSMGAGPAAPSLTTTAGGSLTGQATLYVQTTWMTPWGETLASPESLQAVGDGNELVVLMPANAPGTATGWNVYIGHSSASERLQNSSPLALTNNYTVTAAISTTGASVPGITSAGTYTITSTLGVSYVYCGLNSSTAHYSTASPVSAYTGPQTNIQITVGGQYFSDPQVDTIVVFRTTDGGADYLWEASFPNIVGTGSWGYVDTGMADQNLNVDIQAPQALANNPPPAGLTNICYFAGCMWGSVGSYLYFSNGALTTTGSGNEAWAPLNNALLPSTIYCLVPFPNGMFIFTASDLYTISGPGATPLLYQAGLGISSYNAVVSSGSVVYAFTTDCNVIAINPGAGIMDLGFGIAGDFEVLNPANVSLAFHIFGHKDSALFVCDGAGNHWRCNPNQQPEGGQVWSNKGTVAAGLSALASIETSTGKHQLLATVGSTIAFRDWTTSSDNGTPYAAWMVLGSLVLALPGQLCEVQSITVEAERFGSLPGLAVLLDEISGDFEALPNSISDPPGLPESLSLYSRRFYLNQSTEPVVCRHMQVRIDFGTDLAPNELLSFSIYGALHAE